MFSFGENNTGASWTLISDDTGVSITNMNGGSALNYLLLGFFNIIWIPSAMKFGRKIVFILSLLILCGGSIWGGLYHGVAQYFIVSALQGVGTAAYQALIQLTVSTINAGRPATILILFRSLTYFSRMKEAAWLQFTYFSNSSGLSWDLYWVDTFRMELAGVGALLSWPLLA